MRTRQGEKLWDPQDEVGDMSRLRSMRTQRGHLGDGIVALGAVVAGALCVSAWAHLGSTPAYAGRVLNVRDEGRLHYTKSSGSVVIDEGHASGTFPGWVKVSFSYDGEPTVAARFTIYGSGGSISARGTARLTSPTSPSPSFHGTMTITRGTGRYVHIHGGGALYGVYYRRSYAITVQTISRLPY